jgi:hypothetical protein
VSINIYNKQKKIAYSSALMGSNSAICSEYSLRLFKKKEKRGETLDTIQSNSNKTYHAGHLPLRFSLM